MEANIVDVGYANEDDFCKGGYVDQRGADFCWFIVISASTWADLFNEYLRPPMIIEHAAVKEGREGPFCGWARGKRLLLYRHTKFADR